MKLSAVILFLISSMPFSFAKSFQGLGQSSIYDQSSSFYASQEYHANPDLSDYFAEEIWPWKRKRGCHGGRKQKRRNKKRLKRARA
jgi:hypothetical protein